MVVVPMGPPGLIDHQVAGSPLYGSSLTGGGKRKRKRTNKKKRTTKRKMKRSKGKTRRTIKYSSKKRNTLMNLRAKLKKLY